MKNLYIDGLNAIWRAKVSFGAPSEDPYVVTYNFFRNLKATVEQFKPNKIFFVLEGKPQFRFDLYPEYKGNRLQKYASSSNDNVHLNKNKIIELLEYLTITQIKPIGFECDDAINTLVQKESAEEHIIISNDSDYTQIISESVKVFNPIKKVFLEKPDYDYLSWKSLVGDKSDNITGKLGDKTAQKLLKDNVKFGKWLEDSENNAIYNRNYQLIKFQTINYDQLIFSYGINNFEMLKEKFIEMKFPSMVEEKYWTKFVETFKNL